MKNVSKVSSKTKYSIIGTAGLAFCGVLVETSMNVTFPTLMTQFHESLNNVQWVTTIYLLVVAITMTTTAFAQRRFSLRSLLTSAGLLFVLGILTSGLARSLPILLVGRVIQGISTGLTMPLMFAIIMQQVPLQFQGQYIGLAGMVIAFAPSLGPTYGGFITQTAAWPLIFWITLPIGLVSCLLALSTVQQSAAISKHHFPLLEFMLITVALTTITIGINSAGNHHGVVAVVIPLCIGIISLTSFVIHANRGVHPLINVQIFRNSLFSRALLIYFLVQFIQIGLTFLLPTLAQLALHQGTMLAGMMLLAGSLLSAITAPFTGHLLDTYGAKRILSIGSGFLLLGSCLLFSFSRSLTTATIVVFYAIYMLGFSFTFNNALTFGLQQLTPPQIADGNAAFNTLQQYSGSLGTAVAAAILALSAHHTQLTTAQQTLAGSHNVLLFFVGLCLLATLLIFSLPQTHQPLTK